MLKVLHVIDSLANGGAENLLKMSLEYMQAKKLTENCVVTLFEGGPLESSMKKIVPYKNFQKVNLLKKITQLRRLIVNENIQIVHSHLLRSTLISRLSLPKNKHLVSTYHTGFHDRKSIEFSCKQLWVDKLTYKPKYYTVYVSEAVKMAIKPAIPIKINDQVVYNFSAPQFKPLYKLGGNNELRIVMVGNYREQKNHLLAIEALHLTKNPKISIDIYGYGELEKKLKRLIERYNVKVRLMGLKKITSQLLADYDLYLMTSKHEGMSLALIEAMSTGLPSLLNNLPELKEVAGLGGLYFERNDPVDLAEKMNAIFNDKSVLGGLSKEALAKAKEYSREKYVHSLLKIYKSF